MEPYEDEDSILEKLRTELNRKGWQFALLGALAVLLLFFSFVSIRSPNLRLFSIPLGNIREAIFLCAGVVSALLAFRYLQSGSRTLEFSSDPSMGPRIRAVEYKLADLSEKVKGQNFKSVEFTEEERASILAKIQERLESSSFESYANEIKKIAIENARKETFEERLASTRNRLALEVDNLARRGNLNLILGIATSITGLGVLGYAVSQLPASQNLAEVVGYFFPRVSLAILIEIFAYFFLKLYKQILTEIKYFQNELTNVESKHIALHVAIHEGDNVIRNRILEGLSKTERNFVLLKNQTTVEIEREKINRESNESLISTIKKLVSHKD